MHSQSSVNAGKRSRTAPTGVGEGRPLPIYGRIEQHIRRMIDSGEFPAGSRLPSETELGKAFQTTRATVRQALSKLVYEGLVTRYVGRGSFVATPVVGTFPIDTRHCLPFEEQVAVEGLHVSYGSPSFEIVSAPSSIVKVLSLEPDARVFKLERLRVIGGRPVCLELRYIPEALGRKVTGEMLLTRSAHAFISEIIGYRIPTIVVKVSAIIADASLAKLLDVPQGNALMVRDNRFLDNSGTTLVCGKSIFRGDIETEYVLGPDLRPGKGGAPAPPLDGR